MTTHKDAPATKQNEKFAKVHWTLQDVHDKREELGLEPWNDFTARGFLMTFEKQLEEAMCAAGWEVLEAELDKDDEVTA